MERGVSSRQASRSRSHSRKGKGKGQAALPTTKARGNIEEEKEEVSVTPQPLVDEGKTAEGLPTEIKAEQDADADLIAAAAENEDWLLEELLDLRGSLRRHQEQHDEQKKAQERELTVVKEAIKALQDESRDIRGQVQRMRIVVQNLPPPTPPLTRACEDRPGTACEDRCSHAIALVDQQLRLRLLRFDEALESMRSHLEAFNLEQESSVSGSADDSIADLEPLESAGGAAGKGKTGSKRAVHRVTFNPPGVSSSPCATSPSDPQTSIQGGDGGSTDGSDTAGKATTQGKESGDAPASAAHGKQMDHEDVRRFRSSDGLEACIDALVRLEKEVAKGLSGAGSLCLFAGCLPCSHDETHTSRKVEKLHAGVAIRMARLLLLLLLLHVIFPSPYFEISSGASGKP